MFFLKKNVAFFHQVCKKENNQNGMADKKDNMADNKIDALMKRILDATGINSQSELAKELEIDRSGITHARNNNKIPDKWIVKLYRRFGFNPRWIESGIGNVFIQTQSDPDVEFKYIPKVAARLSAGTGSFECDENLR